MPVKGPEPVTLFSRVLENHRGAVVERGIVHLEAVHDPFERRAERGAGLDEQIQPDVHRARVEALAFFRLERFARVERARFVVAPDPYRGSRGLYCPEHVSGEPLDIIQYVEAAELGAADAEIERMHRCFVELQRKHGRLLLPEPLGDGIAPRVRCPPAHISKAVVREPRALVRELGDELPRRRLTDAQIVLVGLVLRLPSGHGHTHREPDADRREQHRELIVGERAHFVIAGDDIDGNTDRLGFVEHAVRRRVGELEHESARDHVAEVDNARDLAAALEIDENVVVVAVVVDDACRQSVEPGRDVAFERGQDVRDLLSIVICDELDAVPNRFDHVLRVPIKVPALSFVRETFERDVEPRQGAAQRSEQLG